MAGHHTCGVRASWSVHKELAELADAYRSDGWSETDIAETITFYGVAELRCSVTPLEPLFRSPRGTSYAGSELEDWNEALSETDAGRAA